MNDKLLERADSLMRRRAFVAGANDKPGADDSTDPALGPVAHEEVPVLTEVVDQAEAHSRDLEVAATAQSHPDQQIESAVRTRIEQLLLARHSELAVEIENWLDEQMPQLVIRAMDGITDHLVALLANRARDDLLPRLESVMRLPDTAHKDDDETD